MVYFATAALIQRPNCNHTLSINGTVSTVHSWCREEIRNRLITYKSGFCRSGARIGTAGLQTVIDPSVTKSSITIRTVAVDEEEEGSETEGENVAGDFFDKRRQLLNVLAGLRKR